MTRVVVYLLLATAVAAHAGDLPAPATTPSAKDLVQMSSEDLAHDKIDAAMREVSLALELDPRNLAAYELRSSIYIRQKLWDRAEDDIRAADKIQADPAYKYKLGEIKFLQKQYGDARPRFAALRNDPRLGDLATYKVILCDLFGSQQLAATRDLAALDQGEKKPSYYFAHAAYALLHDQRPVANSFFMQAEHLYDRSVVDLYVSSIVEAQRLRLPTATFVTRDGRQFVHARVSLEPGGLRAAVKNGWVDLPLDQLPDDLSTFPEDIRDQITKRRAVAADRASDPSPITFTTTTGKVYHEVHWLLQDAGIGVLTGNGWITVPFDQLPGDLSSFPEDARKKIAEKQKSFARQVTNKAVVSFTTKSGKVHQNLQATISHDGLALLTENGLITLPFSDLPEDLSAFPPEWRAQIESGRQPVDSSDTQLVSFNTRDGQSYTEARTSLARNGLRVLTSQGLETIAFSRLSTDLSPFPAPWRSTIRTAQNKIDRSSTWPTSDLNPPTARDCNFGSSLALQGTTLVVGARGAVYVYDDRQLVARLCPNPDSTRTGDPVTSVAISGETLAMSTSRGIFLWAGAHSQWRLQAALDLKNVSTISIDGDLLLAIADGKGSAANEVRFFKRNGEAWEPVDHESQHDKDTLSADRYGCVAALCGQEALIGVPDWSPASFLNGTAAVSGQACMERFDGSSWAEYALLAPDEQPLGANQFGASVALSVEFAAISSANHDTLEKSTHRGSVYLFRRNTNGWQDEAILTSPNNDAGFGAGPLSLCNRTLAVADGQVAAHADNVVLSNGEQTHKPGLIQNAGAVYLFNGAHLEATLEPPDPMDGLDHRGSPDGFGSSLALTDDTLAVGAPKRNGGAGVVYLWKLETGHWKLAQELRGFHRQLDFDY